MSSGYVEGLGGDNHPAQVPCRRAGRSVGTPFQRRQRQRPPIGPASVHAAILTQGDLLPQPGPTVCARRGPRRQTRVTSSCANQFVGRASFGGISLVLVLNLLVPRDTKTTLALPLDVQKQIKNVYRTNAQNANDIPLVWFLVLLSTEFVVIPLVRLKRESELQALSCVL